MKFTRRLSALLTPEWCNQYINYEELKTMLLSAAEKRASWNAADKLALHTYYARFEEQFFRKCDLELKKVNTFFAEKFAEAMRKHAALMLELEKSLEAATLKSAAHPSQRNMPIVLSKRKAKEFRFALSEFYLSLILLQNYTSLNHTGFRKILKKHDKVLRTQSGNTWFIENVDTAAFFTTGGLMNLIHEIENVFTIHLEGGDRSRAMKRLRVPPLEEVQHVWVTFFVGLFLGAFIVLLAVAYMSFVNARLSTSNYIAALHLYRGPLFVIIFIFLFGINVHGWRNVGVNHILIFEVDPRDFLTATHFMQMAALFGVLWALSFLGYLHAASIGIPPYAFPLALFVLMILFLCNPLHIFYYSARIWLLKLTGRVVAAPFFHVGFADFWLADQMNSLVCCLCDYEYLICFYLNNRNWYDATDSQLCLQRDVFVKPIIRCLPAWFRFVQCLRRYHNSTNLSYPFLINAGKYATTFVVVVTEVLLTLHNDSYESIWLNPFFWCVLITHVISTLYCYAWDIFKDFGLFAKASGEHKYLREQIVYAESFYYFTIIENFILRFFWIISFVVAKLNIMSYYNIATIEGLLEVFRRHIWNYFRLENEHLYNVGRFRAVRDIYVAPIDTNDEVAMELMMDEIDGVSNRRSTLVNKED